MPGVVEVRTHVAGKQQATVEFEGPLVVRANQLGDLALGFGAHLGAAVAAGIVEGTYLAIAATHHRHRVVTHLQGDVLARFFQFESMPGKDPFAMPDLLQILTVYVRVVIGGAWQAVLRFTLLYQAQYIGALWHCYCAPGNHLLRDALMRMFIGFSISMNNQLPSQLTESRASAGTRRIDIF
ncbi:hypothetical protein D3C79_662100 [compost metagenome]